MSQRNIQFLEGLIRASHMLSNDRKNALLQVLSGLHEKHLEHLESILMKEDSIVQNIARNAVQNAVAVGNTKALKQLESFLIASSRIIRKEEEEAEKMQETQDTESLFPDIA